MSLDFRLVFAFSLIGVFALLVFSNFAEPKITDVSKISIKDIDSFVKVRGNITKFDDTENIKILKLQDKTGDIDIIVFEKNILALNKGMQIEVIGKISEYNGNVQINAERIRKLTQDDI